MKVGDRVIDKLTGDSSNLGTVLAIRAEIYVRMDTGQFSERHVTRKDFPLQFEIIEEEDTTT